MQSSAPHRKGLLLEPLLISQPSSSKDSTDLVVKTTVNIEKDNVPHKKCLFGCFTNGILKKILLVKDMLALLIILLIFAGLIYNFIAKDENDIPNEVFQNLYKLLKSNGGIPKSESPFIYSIWAKKIRRRNSSET